MRVYDSSRIPLHIASDGHALLLDPRGALVRTDARRLPQVAKVLLHEKNNRISVDIWKEWVVTYGKNWSVSESLSNRQTLMIAS